MKRYYLMCLMALSACSGSNISITDETSGGDSSDSGITTIDRTIKINFSEEGAVISGDELGIVTANNNDVTVSNTSTECITYELSGIASDGFFKLYSSAKQVIKLDGLSLKNPSGAAINNQSHKYTSVIVSGENTLEDGAVNSSGDYPDETSGEDMKAAFFSEGQLVFSGDGSLTVSANGKAGITSDDYIIINDSPSIKITSTGGHGLRGKESVGINGGSISITTSATGKKGISTDGSLYMAGGTVSIVSTSDAGISDGELTGAAGIKADGIFSIDGGNLNVTVSGKGCKGISCDSDGKFNGGTVTVKATGANYGNSSSQRPGWSDASSSKSSKGIRFEGNLEFNGAAVEVVSAAHEGIEAKGTISITAGALISTASDDALNSGSHLTISGGTVRAISTGNDGIEANGNMYIKGGYIYAVGSGSPELGLDANTEQSFKLYISGGTLLAFGGIESGASITQPVLNVSSWKSGETYSLYSGETLLLEFSAPDKGGNGVVISTPDLVSGSSYTLKSSSGSTSVKAALTSQGGNTGGPGGGGNPGGGPGGRP